MFLFPEDSSPEGLSYVPMWLTERDQTQVLDLINNSDWSSNLGRRTQHFGRRYDYLSGRVGEKDSAPAIPELLHDLAERLYGERVMKKVPDQIIVNEYVVDDNNKQGISAHIDNIQDFGPTVVTLSLLENWTMRFTRDAHPTYDHLLEAGSIAILSGESRYEWMHSIPPRKFDINGGLKIPRNRRISVTFRTAER